MIIPIRCFTCGKVVGSKWEAYLALLQVNSFEQFFSKNKVIKPAFGNLLIKRGINLCFRKRAIDDVSRE